MKHSGYSDRPVIRGISKIRMLQPGITQGCSGNWTNMEERKAALLCSNSSSNMNRRKSFSGERAG